MLQLHVMPKKYFWPLTIVMFGAIIGSTLLGLLPMKMLIIWPILMLIVGLSALVIADNDEWITPEPKHKGQKK